MEEEQIQRIVTRVMERLAARLGADGGRGTLIFVFTGATVAFSEALRQVRSLILDGFRAQLCLSESAGQLYGGSIEDQLKGFPHIDSVPHDKWLGALQDACGVVVPLLSVNTLSKVSLLIADNPATNLILHALFLGKPVAVACDGVDPGPDSGRRHLGFRYATPALEQAVLHRLKTLDSYGCRVTRASELRSVVNDLLPVDKRTESESSKVVDGSVRSQIRHQKRTVTAADIVYARSLGADLILPPGSLVTPLARDLASQHHVAIVLGDDHA
ncbi:MAG: hypothetical protein HY788_23650 [Deltaproteobacteria bacterium]|nr:hypothetical protein [Deltaproteobacteria bacterium]